ncbi:hypothetical protein, partial [Cupriavidus sp. UME77]|uniref:hypothetical protein n=1 Tax=Cupriavidus sp. UME77 TaxID=1862321 RepID=UPI0015FFD037
MMDETSRDCELAGPAASGNFLLMHPLAHAAPPNFLSVILPSLLVPDRRLRKYFAGGKLEHTAARE